MLLITTGVLSHVEELWFPVSQVYLKQSSWHGWILTYISKNILTHCNSQASKNDPFKISFVRNVVSLMKKNGKFKKSYNDIIYLILIHIIINVYFI